jgi:phosphate/sulfate permease
MWCPAQVVALAVGFLWQLYASYMGYNVSATHSISE